MKRALVFAVWVMMLAAAPAVEAETMADFARIYEVDLEKDQLPTLAELQAAFKENNELYDTKYRSVFDLGTVYNRDFYAVAATYGANEKRLKWPEEDELLDVLAAIPKSWYEYIGPMLFTVPTVSDKILNMPGIKETKNKFPSRIPWQLQDVADIEFLSPHLYFMLMPEVWPGNDDQMERPQLRRMHPKVVYDANFYRALKQVVPPEDYAANVDKPHKVTRSDLRTVSPEKNSLLTSSDVKAFGRTIDAVQDWAYQPQNRLKLATISTLIQDYEMNARSGRRLLVPVFKDLINPCTRLVQKATILGQERELAQLVATEGFTLNEWAYTCDKTIKAYRMSYVSLSLMQALRAYKNGDYEAEIAKLSPHNQAVKYSTMQAIIEMYKAPLADVAEVRKNREMLHDKWFKYDFEMAGTEIARLD